MELTLKEIADRLEGVIEGSSNPVIRRVAGIAEARSGDITFLSNRRYVAQLKTTKASAVVVDRDMSVDATIPLLRTDSPDQAFAAIAEWFAPAPIDYPAGIHPSAVIAGDARIGERVHVGPHCVIEAGSIVGDDTVLMAGVYVGHEAVIGASCRLYPHVSLRERVQVGDRVWIHNGSVIGSDGFGYAVNKDGSRTKIPQLGIVVVGDDVEIGANVTIDRARFGRTVIGKGVKIDNLVQIAHNVVIGDHAVIVAQVGIAGSSVIGEKAILAGQAGISGHLVVGAGAVVGAQAGVTKNVAPKTFVSGYPAMPHDKATKIHAHLMKLPELRLKIAELEQKNQR